MESVSAVKECGICNHDFDEDERCPRILPCSHSLCSSCISDVILKNKKKCPYCRQIFVGQSAKDFKINSTTLDLVKYTKYLETMVLSTPKESDMSRAELVEKMKKKTKDMNNQIIADCKLTRDKIEEAVKVNENLQDKILLRHAKIKCDVMNKVKDLDATCDMQVKFLEVEKSKLEKQLEDIKEKEELLQNVNGKLEAAKNFQMVDAALDDAEKTNDLIQTWLYEANIRITKREKLYSELAKNVKCIEEKMKQVLETLISIQENVNGLHEPVAAIALQEDLQTQITKEVLQEKNPIIMYLTSLRGVYAVQELEGRIRSGRISISNNQLYIHCLKEQELPQNVATIEHCEVLTLMDPSSRNAFLEFGTEESFLGRVHIHLSPDTKRAQNFALFCSGKMGPSYIASPFMLVGFEGIAGEYVEFGEYQYNNETLRKSLVAGAGCELGGVLTRPQVAGAVFGWFEEEDVDGALFSISTISQLEDKTSHTIFGMVQSGLHVLTEMVSLHHEMEIKIIDCGLVLPL